MPCNHATDDMNLCVYRCDASVRELLALGVQPITLAPADDEHICAGDNCVCIGGDEDKNPCDVEPDDADIHPHDYSDDAEALASAGWGTDEDYGYFGGDD